jgi:uncharacterized peroxidase-related enzyme
VRPGKEEITAMSARLPYVERDQATPEVQKVYDRLQERSGRVLNFFKLLAHHARSLAEFVDWYPKLREGPLDLKLRQLAYVKVSQLNHCWYCTTHNMELGQKVGVSKDRFNALPDYTKSPLFSPVERLVIRYAEEMTKKVQVEGALVTQLRDALGAEALMELTLSIAAANFTNRVNEALGTELER